LPHVSISSSAFRRQFRLLVLLAWIVPPVFGMAFMLFLHIFTPDQIFTILVTPLQPAFIVANLALAFWLTGKWADPVTQYLADKRSVSEQHVLDRIKQFPLVFWALFLGYLMLAPASVILSVEYYTDYIARPVDWFRVHLTALIVSIVVGLPIFFLMFDLFGRAISGIPIRRPYVTVRTKVVLIGALVPLLIDTTLVQYFWSRTGQFDAELFGVWFVLELLAIGGSLIFARSFGQSLSPLRQFVNSRGMVDGFTALELKALSTDELGVITSDIQGLAEQLKLQSEILEIRNQLLAGTSAGNMLGEAFIDILDIADVAVGADRSYLLIHDPATNELVNVAYSGAPYRENGYYRLSMTSDASLAVLAFKSGQTIAIDDVRGDARVNRRVVDEQKIVSAIGTPLRYGEATIGALISATSQANCQYSEREIRLMEVLAQEAALVTNALMLSQEQQRAEKRYRQLNELAPDPILLIDDAGRLAEINHAAEALLDLPREQLIGKPIHTFISKCEPAYLLGGMKDIQHDRTILCQAELRNHNDHGPVIVDVHASRVQLGEHSMVQAFLRDITASQIAEDSLRKSEGELSGILNSMQDTFFRTDIDGHIVRVSPSVEKLLGYTPDDLLGERLGDLFIEKRERRRFLVQLKQNDGSVKGFQVPLRRKNGATVWVSTNAQYCRDDAGNITGIEGTTRDMTKYRRTQEELFKEKERAQVTLESIGDGVVTTDVSGTIEYINPVAEHLCGWSLEEAEGHTFEEVFRLLEESRRIAIENPILQCLEKRHSVSSNTETILTDRLGSEHAVEYSAAPIRDREGGLVGVVVGLHDVTVMRQMAQQLTHQATHDALTGLINRREFETRLKAALDSAHQEEVQHALCYLDLDQFKVVNDTCGHVAGDKLLQQVTARLKEHVRKADTLARLGGDEFGVLLWNCPLETAERVSDELRKVVKEYRFSWEDKIFEVGVSIGLVPIVANSGTLTDVLSAADSACYAAKDRGRNRVHVYQPDDKLLSERHGEMQWVSRIGSALDEDRLTLYGQRIMSLSEDNPDHWEILVRLREADGTIVPPMAFIPAAERYHIMPAIDRWVLKHAFQLISNHTPSHEDSGLVFNFNLSGQSLSDDGLLAFLIDQIESSAIDPEKICFEITETAAIADLMHATRFIAVMTGLGCHFALDDFGSGLSSFAYLKNLNVSYLKIDGGFVRNMVNDRIDRAMVESINHVGHTLGIKTIAEFVETAEVLGAVSQLGVDYAQGYCIAKPVPIDDTFFRRDTSPVKGAKVS
jgi:diguanylate cyclase (GGDEF)-like protein/PAS domain S-box-containing protein